MLGSPRGRPLALGRYGGDQTRGKPRARGGLLCSSDGGEDPGQVGDSSGGTELGGGLATPEILGLPQTQLPQPGPEHCSSAWRRWRFRVRKPTLLERACGLQETFLRVQTDLPPVPRSRGHTAGAARTGLTVRRVKVKRAPGRTRSAVASDIGAPLAHRALHLARWTGAGTRRQVKLEIPPGENGTAPVV